MTLFVGLSVRRLREGEFASLFEKDPVVVSALRQSTLVSEAVMRREFCVGLHFDSGLVENPKRVPRLVRATTSRHRVWPRWRGALRPVRLSTALDAR
jgi:hypothetical protein